MNTTSILILGLLLVFLWGFSDYNRFVEHKRQVEETWKAIHAWLKKRHALIQTLVGPARNDPLGETVLRHHAAAIHARNRPERIQAETVLEDVLKQWQAAHAVGGSVPYPNPRRQLDFVEHQLTLARRCYNRMVYWNNFYVKRFPSNLIAALLGFREGPFYGNGESGPCEARDS